LGIVGNVEVRSRKLSKAEEKKKNTGTPAVRKDRWIRLVRDRKKQPEKKRGPRVRDGGKNSGNKRKTGGL